MTSVLRSVRASMARLVFGSVTLGVAAIAATLLPATSAGAQGTSCQLPEPLSVQDLTRFLDRYVRPSAAQWDTIDLLHEQYKVDFKRLRDGEIEEFLEKSKKFQGTMPQRSTIEEWTKDYTRLFSKIKTLDNRLFDQVQGTLEDEQIRAMPRVKLARERATYCNQNVKEVVGGLPTDLWDVLAGLELSRSDLAPLDPTLISYESQLTKKLEELNDTYGTTSLLALQFDALILPDLRDIEDPEERMKSMNEAFRQAWMDASRKGREINADIAKLNNKTRKTLTPLLPENKRPRFRRDFVARAYSFFGAVDTGTDSTFRTAMRFKALSDEQRAALKQSLDGWVRDDERLENELIEAMDKVNLELSPMAPLWAFDASDNPAQPEVEQEVEKHRQRRLEVAALAVNNARAIVGPELAAKLEQPGGPEQDALLADAEAGAGEAGAGAPAPTDAEMKAMLLRDGSIDGGDVFLASKIDAATVALWSRRLALDKDQRAMLDALHADYLQQWQDVVGPHVASIGAASEVAYGQRTVPPTECAIDGLYAARQAGMQQAEKVERTFLDNVRLAVVDDAHKPAFEFIALERELYSNVGSLRHVKFEGNRESQVNIAGVVTDALDDADLAAAAAVVLNHAEALRTTTREVRRTTFENWRNFEKLVARREAPMKDGEGAVAASVDHQKEMNVTQEQANAAGAARRDVVRTVLAELKEKLPEEQARKVERDYKRGAFPRAYADSRSAEPLIERARNLNDLTEEQTKQLAALSEEFQPAYEAVADKMAELIRDEENPFDPHGWQKWMERRNKLARLRFEGDEVSMKSVRKLKPMLTEEQVKRIPGLMSYAQQQRENPFGAFGE